MRHEKSSNPKNPEDVDERVSLYEQDLTRGAGFEQLHLANTILVGGQRGWMASTFVEWNCELSYQSPPHLT